MTNRSLRPHLNQIRSWVKQNRTDAWIAHQLDVSVQQIKSFKRENELAPVENESEQERDLRAEDDKLVAAELEADEVKRQAQEAEQKLAQEQAEKEKAQQKLEETEEEKPKKKPARRRSTRRRKPTKNEPLEGTFDHGEDGYGLWLDPAVTDNALYAEHWAGRRAVQVIVEADQIIIRPADQTTESPDSETSS